MMIDDDEDRHHQHYLGFPIATLILYFLTIINRLLALIMTYFKYMYHIHHHKSTITTACMHGYINT